MHTIQVGTQILVSKRGESMRAKATDMAVQALLRVPRIIPATIRVEEPVRDLRTNVDEITVHGYREATLLEVLWSRYSRYIPFTEQWEFNHRTYS